MLKLEARSGCDERTRKGNALVQRLVLGVASKQSIFMAIYLAFSFHFPSGFHFSIPPKTCLTSSLIASSLECDLPLKR